jgi:REP-associated tyrosine transposase
VSTSQPPPRRAPRGGYGRVVPRPLRLQVAGGVYHVTARGNRRQPVFLDPNDRRFHLWCLDRATERYRWRCDAYCQMTNHFHLLIRLTEPNLSRGMQWLNGLYAQVFNARHRFSGHLFQGRFHSTLVGEDGHVLELARYIVLNPVRAGICDHPLEWRWSSCRATLGLDESPVFLDHTWLLGQFAAGREEGRRRYLRFVEDRLELT